MRYTREGKVTYPNEMIIEDFNDPNILKKFMEKVVATQSCWWWTGAKSKSYRTGHRIFYGVVTIKRQMYYAHRVSYMLHYGTIPDGMYVMHTCDNPMCVNPKHLKLGTPLDNIKDCKEKGRLAVGQNHGRSKLKNDDVQKIRQLDNFMSRAEIARLFKCCPSTVSAILNGKIWKSLPPEGEEQETFEHIIIGEE